MPCRCLTWEQFLSETIPLALDVRLWVSLQAWLVLLPLVLTLLCLRG